MEILDLEWDDDNVLHIARHHVNPDEVEDVIYGIYLYSKDPDSKSSGDERYIISGRTRNGRYLNVVVKKIYKTRYRPITAFEMSENYIRRFKKRLERRGIK